MTAEYSAHPALASAQLQRAESSHNSQSHHRRHAYSKSASAGGCGSGSGGGGGIVSHSSKSTVIASIPKSATIANSTATLTTDAQTTLPDRTANAAALQKSAASATNADDVDDDDDDDVFGVDCNDVNTTTIIEDDEEDASIDELDHVQHRFSRTTAATAAALHQLTTCSCATHFHQHLSCSSSSVFDGAVGSRSDVSCDGCGASSGFSSAGSSPSASTTSSPLSTPTRLVAPPHCCQKTAAGAAAAAAAAATASSAAAAAATASSTTEHHQQHQHQHPHAHLHLHHHHHPHHHNGSGCKKLQKFDPRLGPSPYRQLLPIALCILSFATVFSILIVYMDTTEIRHQQFRMNMSRNNELYGVAQDDPELIAFLREIQMNKYPMHFLKNRDAPDQSQHLNFNEHHELAPEMAHYVADLLGSKVNGSVIQSLPGAMGQVMTAPWLAGTLNWTGVIVEPEPQRFFALRKQNARNAKLQVVHACVSPNAHPKEVTIHNEEADVRINSLLDEETSWFYSRVKCFPLYAIMLACNRVEYDLLSLGVRGHELDILQTLPFEKINIEVISIHLPDDHENVRPFVKPVTQFLKSKSYKLQKSFGRNYFYQKINATNRTRKKDILLMKQP